jgi:hypothetical protein
VRTMDTSDLLGKKQSCVLRYALFRVWPLLIE